MIEIHNNLYLILKSFDAIIEYSITIRVICVMLLYIQLLFINGIISSI
jgi:hypothetical protein